MPLQFKNIAVGNLQDDVSGNNYAANKAVYILNLNNTLAQIFSDEAGTTPIVQDGVNNVTGARGVFGFWVEAGDYLVQVGANKYRVSITGADYFNNRVDETVDLIVDSVAGRGAYYVVGSFEAGFTYTDINQVGTFGGTDYYIYTGGLTNLSHPVPAGTDPTSSSDYAQVFYGEINDVQGLRDELNDRALYLTLAEAKAKNDLVSGQYVRLSDHADGLYQLVANADAGGFYKTGLQNNLKLKLEINDNTIIDQFDSTVTNATVNAAATFVKTLKFSQDKTYNLDNITLPDHVSIEAHPSTTFKKSADGFIFDLGRLAHIKGGPTFDGSQSDLGYTGNSVIISRGDNVPNKLQQGHQRIFDASFTNSDGYHVRYSQPNKGWMSELLRCKFLDLPANSVANVLWPDETTAGGNRKIIGGYSAGPVCNVKGADNGLIDGVEIGATDLNLDNQMVYFDPTSVNLARKLRVVNCRGAIADGTLRVRHADQCIFEGNIIAGDVVFDTDATNCAYDSTNIQSSIVDSSGEQNIIDIQDPQFFTPTINTGITIGNGTIQGEYSREGYYIDFRIELTIGSTTAITGSMVFNLPVPVVSGGQRTFLGNAWYAGYVGQAYIQQNDSTVRVYGTATQPSVWNATNPKAPATNDTMVIQGRYRI